MSLARFNPASADTGHRLRFLAVLTTTITLGTLGALSMAAPTAAGASAPPGVGRALPTRAQSPGLSGLAFTPLPAPTRIADTRSAATDPATYAGDTLSPGGELTVDMPGAVPSTAGAVVAQLTAISPTAPGYLSAFPAGTSWPGTANVNFTTSQIVGNLVTVALGVDPSTGAPAITIYNGPAAGPDTDLTFDLYGYYAPPTATAGDTYVPLTPTRIFDTRPGSGYAGQGQTLGGDGTVGVPVTGVGGVPQGAAAVVVNIAVTDTTAPSYIQGYPTGSPPSSSTPTVNQNWVAGETLSTKGVIGVGTAGSITLANHAGDVDVVVDVDGYFTAPGGSGLLFNALSTPVRILDTRPGGIATGNSATATIQGVNAGAGVLNMADISGEPGVGDYLTAYPAGQSVPVAADVNYVPGDSSTVVDNASYATTGAGGAIGIFNGPADGPNTNVVVDEFGWFSAAGASVGACSSGGPSFMVPLATTQVQVDNVSNYPDCRVATLVQWADRGMATTDPLTADVAGEMEDGDRVVATEYGLYWLDIVRRGGLLSGMWALVPSTTDGADFQYTANSNEWDPNELLPGTAASNAHTYDAGQAVLVLPTGGSDGSCVTGQGTFVIGNSDNCSVADGPASASFSTSVSGVDHAYSFSGTLYQEGTDHNEVMTDSYGDSAEINFTLTYHFRDYTDTTEDYGSNNGPQDQRVRMELALEPTGALHLGNLVVSGDSDQAGSPYPFRQYNWSNTMRQAYGCNNGQTFAADTMAQLCEGPAFGFAYITQPNQLPATLSPGDFVTEQQTPTPGDTTDRSLTYMLPANASYRLPERIDQVWVPGPDVSSFDVDYFNQEDVVVPSGGSIPLGFDMQMIPAS